MAWLGALFCVGVLLFGRFKGLNTLISLLFTCLAVFAVYIPSILSGQNLYIWTVVVCFYIIVMTMLLINGLDKKSLCAGLGCFCGVLVAGLITFIMSRMMNLTGMASEDTLYLTMLELEKPIDLKAIIFGTITIGALGAVMDVAMDISSSLMRYASMTRRSPAWTCCAPASISAGTLWAPWQTRWFWPISAATWPPPCC